MSSDHGRGPDDAHGSTPKATPPSATAPTLSPGFLGQMPENPGPKLRRKGHVESVIGTLVTAVLPSARIGEECVIERLGMPGLRAEVVAFAGERSVKLAPFGELRDVACGATVRAKGHGVRVPCGDTMRGRVLDALAEPLDGSRVPEHCELVDLVGPPPSPLARSAIREQLATGIRAIDALTPVGVGQRMGIFAGPGVGKSKLLSMLARSVEADLVVLALIGERGREVLPFVQDDLGMVGPDARAGMAYDAAKPAGDASARAVVVVSTSEQPALLRLKAAHSAMAIAEHARSRGQRVLLLLDSLTRFARAQRDVGLSADEPSGRGGYPPSVFAELPRLLERAGNDGAGSITAFFTVLKEVEDDRDKSDVIVSEVKSLLDGHLQLSSLLAGRRHYPAIDFLSSRSRLDSELSSPERKSAMSRFAEFLRVAQQVEREGSFAKDSGDGKVAQVRELGAAVLAFLRQGEHERSDLSRTVSEFLALAARMTRF